MPHDLQRRGPDAQERTEAESHTHRTCNSSALASYRALPRSRPAVQTDPVGLLLSRLERVRQYGKGWRADCPCGHSSKATLSITTGADGRALAHCFVGCSAAEIAEAAGLRLQDLFATPVLRLTPQERQEARQRMRAAGWAAALDTLAREADTVRIAAAYPMRGEMLTAEDHARLTLAVERITTAREVLHG